MKHFYIILGAIVIGGIAVFLWIQSASETLEVTNEAGEQVTEERNQGTQTAESDVREDTETGDDNRDAEDEVTDSPVETIGRTVENRAIEAYHYGEGDTEVLFIGGIHAGYSPNTVVVAFELMDYLEATPSAIPEGVRVTVIPVLNPDGLYKVTGKEGRITRADMPATTEAGISGRFNAMNVDLNRNFDCDWKATGVWQNRNVSGGSSAFSEAESSALKDYVDEQTPDAVVAWYAAAGGVFSSNCYNGVLPETKTLTNLYANASGYQAYEEFNFYEINGDMVNWFASMQIPAISVLLTDHRNSEWTKNKAGIDAILNYYKN